MILIILKAAWQIACSGPVVWVFNYYACTAMFMVATTFTVAILLWAGSHPTQLMFYTAWESMTAKCPPAT